MVWFIDNKMSVRAYRVISKEIEEEPSFNVWHDKELLDWLEEQKDTSIRMTAQGSGEGEIEININVLKKAIKNAKKLKLDEDIIEALKADIAFAKNKGDEYVLYECY